MKSHLKCKCNNVTPLGDRRDFEHSPYRDLWESPSRLDAWTSALADIQVVGCWFCDQSHFHLHCMLGYLLVKLDIMKYTPPNDM